MAALHPPPSAPLVFITGASSGIGQALASRFARAGFRLALVARRSAELQAWSDAEGHGPERCRVYSADVADTDSIVAAGLACLAAQGVPDVVIANAGISIGMDTAERGDIDVMARTFATNNTGLAATFHPFLSAMVARGSGSLVGIASVAAIRGLPGHGAYCASKAGVVAYCESLRGELRGSGVAVLSAETFADRAFDAISAQTSYRVIPWQMGVVAKLLRLLPNPLYDRLLAGRPRKHREPQPHTRAEPPEPGA
ncbi:MAG: short-chain dehydrogenase [Burkholderiales bacterium RIFCSPLOWO2_12_FULL_67_210]|nr:MAG: short-chain dehydrogenase [Burkholderiales bacterium RIFCSPLOWO2_12_FULL_67_210]